MRSGRSPGRNLTQCPCEPRPPWNASGMHLSQVSPEKRKLILADLIKSVQPGQPIRTGSGGGEPMRINLLTWASNNLSASGLTRVAMIDEGPVLPAAPLLWRGNAPKNRYPGKQENRPYRTWARLRQRARSKGLSMAIQRCWSGWGSGPVGSRRSSDRVFRGHM